MRLMRFFHRDKLPDLVSAVCTAFMLCAIPLVFRNAFFDINRVKVEAVCKVMPWLAAVMVSSVCLSRKKKELDLTADSLPACAMLAFLVSCVVSCAFTGFERAVIDGSEGRYCGLAFTLCCGAAFFVISKGNRNDRLVLPMLICAAAVAALGFINALGFDPLGFYTRIKKGQEQVYLSTIGHFDFFGTYLVMLFPFAGSQFAFARSRGMQAFGLICSVAMAFGAMASRTDSALAGIHLGCYLLLAISGGSLQRMARALALWAVSFAALPITFRLLAISPYHPDISGLPLLLFELHVCEFFALALFAACVFCLNLSRRDAKAPGRKKLALVMGVAFAIAMLILLALVLYFSLVDTQTDLGGAASLLRFNDSWGSLRGFAWIRSIRAFSDYDLRHKLFGSGMELTLRVLKPYFDNPAMLVSGVFNDPHCQLLQILLTCGLLGLASFAALYLLMLAALARRAGSDPLLAGALGSVVCYSVILLINVTQPILIATYFSICGLSVCLLRKNQGGKAT